MQNWMTWAALAAMVLIGPADAKEEAKPESSKLAVGTKVGTRLPHFQAELLDVSGAKAEKTAFDSHKNGKATAYVFMSRTCPYCRQYQARLAAMVKAFSRKGVQFVMVYPTRATSLEKKVAYHKAAGFSSPLINDKDASIAKALRIKKTPEVVLVSKEGKIVFRGGIDDNPRDEASVKNHGLKNACADVAAGRDVKVTTAPLYG